MLCFRSQLPSPQWVRRSVVAEPEAALSGSKSRARFQASRSFSVGGSPGMLRAMRNSS
jgi:hypothetical protein